MKRLRKRLRSIDLITVVAVVLALTAAAGLLVQVIRYPGFECHGTTGIYRTWYAVAYQHNDPQCTTTERKQQ